MLEENILKTIRDDNINDSMNKFENVSATNIEVEKSVSFGTHFKKRR